MRRLHQRGLKPRIFRQREKLRHWLSDPQHCAQLRCLVAAGGDGTVNDLVTRYPGMPLAIFPMGTENLFAKFLRIPRDGRQLADLIIDGHTRRFDLARLGDRRFCIMAGVGLDAVIVQETHSRRRGHIRKWQYIRPIWQAWRNAMTTAPLHVICDGQPLPETARAVFVMNQPAYALGFHLADHAAGRDGLLDLRLVNWSSRLELLWLAWHAYRGGWERLPQVRCAMGRVIQIAADAPVPVQIDGDPAGFTPIQIELLPDALDVFVP